MSRQKQQLPELLSINFMKPEPTFWRYILHHPGFVSLVGLSRLMNLGRSEPTTGLRGGGCGLLLNDN